MTLDEATDELYGADLDAFVAERTRLARELKESGDGEAAATLAKLKKPTVAAWALNQLARRHRRDVDLLLDAGHRLRQAQEGVVGGADRAAFEQAQKTEREALRRLTQQASELLGGASSQVLSQLTQTLRAAAVSEDGRELLARGRFTAPLETEGFDVFGALPPSPSGEGEEAGQDAEGERRAEAGARAAARAGAEGEGGGAGRRAAEGRVEEERARRRIRTGGGRSRRARAQRGAAAGA